MRGTCRRRTHASPIAPRHRHPAHPPPALARRTARRGPGPVRRDGGGGRSGRHGAHRLPESGPAGRAESTGRTGHAPRRARLPDRMEGIPRRPAAAGGAQRRQHRLRLHRCAARRVRAGGRRAVRLRGRRAGRERQRSAVRARRLARARRGGPQGQAHRATEGIEFQLPAGAVAQARRPDGAGHPADLPAARRGARRLRERRGRRLGGLGPVLRARADRAEGAHARRLHRAAVAVQLL